MGVDYLVMLFFKGGGACPLKIGSEYTEKIPWCFFYAKFTFCVKGIDLLSKPVCP